MKLNISFIKFICKIIDFKANIDFIDLFYRKEGKELMGKKFRNFWILTIIMFLTFLAIGFANGSLRYLKKKMDDPFVNFVNIVLPTDKAAKAEMIKYELNKDSTLKNELKYQNVVGHNSVYLSFYKKEKGKVVGSMQSTGRTIDNKDQLLPKIFERKNFIKGRSFVDEFDIGLIVTEDFLSHYNYDENSLWAYLSLAYSYNKDTLVPLPIIAVVKELPGLNKFAVTPYFANQYWDAYGYNPFSPKHTLTLNYFFQGTNKRVELLKNDMISYLKELDYLTKMSWDVELFLNAQAYDSGYVIQIAFYPKLEVFELKQISEDILLSRNLSKYNLVKVYDFNLSSNFESRPNDYLTINFEKTDKIRDAREHVARKYDLKIDMAQIESMENYNFVSNLTRILSFVLTVFSIVSISLFVSNLLSKHLEKIKMNIGTFKAFGMENILIIKIYILISYVVIISSMISGIILSWLFSVSYGIKFLLFIFRMNLEKGQTYFNLIDFWTLFAILAIVITNFIVLQYVVNRMLNKTPGDLIYSR